VTVSNDRRWKSGASGSGQCLRLFLCRYMASCPEAKLDWACGTNILVRYTGRSKGSMANFIRTGLWYKGRRRILSPPDWNKFARSIRLSLSTQAAATIVVRGGFGVLLRPVHMNPFLDFRPHIAAGAGHPGNRRRVSCFPYSSKRVTRQAVRREAPRSSWSYAMRRPNCPGNPGLKYILG